MNKNVLKYCIGFSVVCLVASFSIAAVPVEKSAPLLNDAGRATIRNLLMIAADGMSGIGELIRFES